MLFINKLRFLVTSVGSKEGQDKFVKTLIPNSGYFLDIGCEHPMSRNNTWLLEQSGWTGILIDKSKISVNLCKKSRKSPTFCLDVEKIKWREFLKENNCPSMIDYISLDVDESNLSFINNFPWDDFEFKIMTLETDFYKLGNKIKHAANNVFSKYENYHKAVDNVKLTNGLIFEDWWVNKKYISISPIKNICWKDVIKNVEHK